MNHDLFFNCQEPPTDRHGKILRAAHAFGRAHTQPSNGSEIRLRTLFQRPREQEEVQV